MPHQRLLPGDGERTGTLSWPDRGRRAWSH